MPSLTKIPPAVHAARAVLLRRQRLFVLAVFAALALVSGAAVGIAAGVGVFVVGAAFESVVLALLGVAAGAISGVGSLSAPFVAGAIVAMAPSSYDASDAQAVVTTWARSRRTWARTLVEPELNLLVDEAVRDTEDVLVARDEVQQLVRRTA